VALSAHARPDRSRRGDVPFDGRRSRPLSHLVDPEKAWRPDMVQICTRFGLEEA
jgi:hypothetical protein